MSNTDTQKTSDTSSAANGRVGSSDSSAPILPGGERRKAFGLYWETKRDFLKVQIGEGLAYALFSRGWNARDTGLDEPSQHETDEDAFDAWNRDVTEYVPTLWDAYLFGLNRGKGMKSLPNNGGDTPRAKPEGCV